MNLFAKTGSWVVALLVVAAAPVFGQNKTVADSKCCPAPADKCCPPKKVCEEVKKIQLSCAYNAPARIEVRGCWDVYASASFTYWQPIQDNMELGVVTTTNADGSTDGIVENFNANFKPGFKVALGMNFDHDSWDTQVQYTWFRGTTSKSRNLDPTVPAEVLLPLWTVPASSEQFFAGSEKWKVHMDLLDWELGRSYYVGKKLTFRPFFAVRGAWIRQNLDVNYTAPVFTNLVSEDKVSRSWAVGPRAGLYTDWMFCDGFRLFGNGAGDILFTRYTTLRSVETVGIVPATVTQRNLDTVRPHLDLELGLGWGSYFDCNNWHIDLSAGYNFQVFFDQNMFRHFDDDIATVNSTSPNGNLYLQGLTITARVDF